MHWVENERQTECDIFIFFSEGMVTQTFVPHFHSNVDLASHSIENGFSLCTQIVTDGNWPCYTLLCFCFPLFCDLIYFSLLLVSFTILFHTRHNSPMDTIFLSIDECHQYIHMGLRFSHSYVSHHCPSLFAINTLFP